VLSQETKYCGIMIHIFFQSLSQIPNIVVLVQFSSMEYHKLLIQMKTSSQQIYQLLLMQITFPNNMHQLFVHAQSHKSQLISPLILVNYVISLDGHSHHHTNHTMIISHYLMDLHISLQLLQLILKLVG